MIILGSGMSGCIAAILNGGAKVYEASSTPPLNHNAVLRFRTDAISKATGIPFKKVKVYKGIYVDGQHVHTCCPALANAYSRKVTGRLLNRSIWDLAPSERFVAPNDFHSRLIAMVGNRIEYGKKITRITKSQIVFGCGASVGRHDVPVVSTIPMPVMSMLTGVGLDQSIFKRQSVTTARAKIGNCDVNQTIYFPQEDTALYRATITGGDLILEFTGDSTPSIEYALKDLVLPAFGLKANEVGDFAYGTQQYGKIAPVDAGTRKDFMFQLTRSINVYSLGRFGCWRNILLDDVYMDVFAIRRMIEQSHYDIAREMA